MQVIEGIYPDSNAFPFDQLWGQFYDAKVARQNYDQLKQQPGIKGLIVYDKAEIVALLLLKGGAERTELVAGLRWNQADVTEIWNTLMLYFSQQRIAKLVLHTRVQSDLVTLETYDFVSSRDGELTKEFAYPTAIVFGGGGAHGAFLSGAYRVLAEKGIVPDMLYGVSVGSITGMSLMHLDPTISEATWAKLTTQMVYAVDEVGRNRLDFTKNLTTKFLTRQYFNQDSLRSLIRPVVEYELAQPDPIPFTLIATELPTFRATPYRVTPETTVDELTDWILASSAFYPLVAPMEIDGRRYIDGGYSNNVPVALAAEDGAKEIYAISIMGNELADTKVPADVNVHWIKSPWQLGPLLDFDPDESKQYLRMGELRARKVFGDLSGYYYSFNDEPNFAWLGGMPLIRWLATDSVTAPIAELLQQPSLWFMWYQWLSLKTGDDLNHDPDRMGLALVEQLAMKLEVDFLTVYTLDDFVEAIIRQAQAGKLVNLPRPQRAIKRLNLVMNWEIVLTAVLYLLSKNVKKGKI